MPKEASATLKPVRRSSTLEAPAGRVWELLQKPATLQFVSAGRIHYQTGNTLPPKWSVGEQVNLKPKLFNWFDQGDYFVTFVVIDEPTMTMVTNEESDAISFWRHTMRVSKVSENQCTYTDEIHIDAGSRTWLVRAFAKEFYRHRHQRWKQLLAEK